MHDGIHCLVSDHRLSDALWDTLIGRYGEHWRSLRQKYQGRGRTFPPSEKREELKPQAWLTPPTVDSGAAQESDWFTHRLCFVSLLLSFYAPLTATLCHSC